MSGRKKAGSLRGVGAHTTTSARRLNPIQDLNSPPIDGEGTNSTARISLVNDAAVIVDPTILMSIQGFQPSGIASETNYALNLNNREGSSPNVTQMEMQASP